MECFIVFVGDMTTPQQCWSDAGIRHCFFLIEFDGGTHRQARTACPLGSHFGTVASEAEHLFIHSMAESKQQKI